MTYGDRLQRAMDDAKVDRKMLAERLKISVQAVGQVINGDTKAFDAQNHTKAFLYLGCDPLWLSSGHYAAPLITRVVAREPAATAWHDRFKALDFALVNELARDDLLRLEGAWLLAAKQLGFSLGKRAAA